ncbi:MAG: ROK family protein [Sphingomonas fennica]
MQGAPPNGTICADVGGSFVDIAVIAGEAEILARRKWPTPMADWDGFAAIFRDAAASFARIVAPGSPVAIATAGLADPGSGRLTAANVPAIHGRRLVADLSALLDRPVILLNDADAFVLGEAAFGVARGHQRVFGAILGTGVGGGLIEDGRIVTGPDGIGGEWGHGQIIPDTPGAPGASPLFPCGCGRRGCLDTVGGARGLERLHRFLHGRDADSHTITTDWTAGDPSATATIAYFVEIVGGAIAMLLNTFPASIVPVGGGLSAAPGLIELLDRKVREGLLRRTTAPILHRTRLGGDAGLLGAYMAAITP